MSIKFAFTADNSDVIAKLGEIKQQMGDLSWADMAMGVQAVVGLLNQAKSAIAGLMAPAAALEDMGVKLGVMLNNRTAGGTLASSLERLATNGVMPMQELERAAAALKLVVQLGTAWAAAKAVNIAAGVWAAVKALKAAVVEARARAPH